ncbi:MAG: hypothetical protein ACJA2O_004444 [Candidatus Azotimanducaceae bacterium]|jgi:hypothetical protein
MNQLYEPVGKMLINAGFAFCIIIALLAGLALMIPLTNIVLPFIYSVLGEKNNAYEISLDSLILGLFVFYIFLIRRLNFFFRRQFAKYDKYVYEFLTSYAVPFAFIGLSFLVAFSLPLFRELSESANGLNLCGARFHAIQYAMILSGVSCFMIAIKLCVKNRSDPPVWFFAGLALLLSILSILSQLSFDMTVNI